MSGTYSIPDTGTLKMAKVKAATVNGVATLLIKVPGTFNPDRPARIIEGGKGWFEGSHHDDSAEVFITDEDNILQQGAGTPVGSYTDTGVPEANQGWFLYKGELEVRALAGIGRLLGGLWVKIIAKTGDNRADTFRANIIWGDPDDK